MNREEIIAANPILKILQEYGLQFRRAGGALKAICPFHDDQTPSLRVNVDKQLWICDPCNKGGSVIDFVMLKEGISAMDAMEKLGNFNDKAPKPELKEVDTYDYVDENGVMLYQVVRYEGFDGKKKVKSFKQRHKNSDDQWVWTMDGVRRVLYNLFDVQDAQDVWVVEGEKDAKALISLGFPATTNVGGAKKWLDSYSDSLKGKNVVVCPDSDPVGKEHGQMVIKSLAGKAKTIFLFDVTPFKDVSDLIEKHGDAAKAEILRRLDGLKPINPAPDLPVYSLEELEGDYYGLVENFGKRGLNLSKWLPGLNSCVRALVPGDVVLILADTGVGKTTAVANLAYHSGLPTLIFELELPGSRMFERCLQMALQKSGDDIFQAYRSGTPPQWKMLKELKNIFICPLSRMNPQEMERIVDLAELKMGCRPALVAVDYMQLMQGIGGTRYERASYVAEQMKIIAKSTGTIVIEASQAARPLDKTGKTREMTLHDGKDSGSLESSAGLVLGAWRDEEDALKIKVLKNSNGSAGKVLTCNFCGETMRITERAIIDFEDIPQRIRNQHPN